jgi:hypothetical protein
VEVTGIEPVSAKVDSQALATCHPHISALNLFLYNKTTTETGLCGFNILLNPTTHISMRATAEFYLHKAPVSKVVWATPVISRCKEIQIFKNLSTIIPYSNFTPYSFICG